MCLNYTLSPKFFLYLLALLVNFIIAFFLTSYPIVSDEVIYLINSRHIAKLLDPSVQDIPLLGGFSNLIKEIPNPIYHILLAPTILLGQWQLVFLFIKLFNTFLISLLAPLVFAIGRRLGYSSLHATAFALVSIALPYNNFASIVMVESLYYPAFYALILMFLWVLSRANVPSILFFALACALICKIKIVFFMLPIFFAIAMVLSLRMVNKVRCYFLPAVYLTATAIILLLAQYFSASIGGYSSDISSYINAFRHPIQIAISFVNTTTSFLGLTLATPALCVLFLPQFLKSIDSTELRAKYLAVFVVVFLISLFSIGFLSIHVISVNGWSPNAHDQLVHERLYGYLAPLWFMLAGKYFLDIKDKSRIADATYLIVILIWVTCGAWYSHIPEGHDVIHSSTLSLHYILGKYSVIATLLLACISMFIYFTRPRFIFVASILVLVLERGFHFYRIAFYAPTLPTELLYYPKTKLVDDRNVTKALYISKNYPLTVTYRAIMIGARIMHVSCGGNIDSKDCDFRQGRTLLIQNANEPEISLPLGVKLIEIESNDFYKVRVYIVEGKST